MSVFFPSHRGLAVFLNAGDPPLDVLADVARMLDDHGVGCLELAVPFPNSVTDGPVIRRSADRALTAGVGLDDALAFVTRIRHELRTLRIALLADWSATVRPAGLDHFVAAAANSGVDGVLLHGAPPRCRPQFYELADGHSLPVVTTCYAQSSPETLDEAAAHASAYVYLVAHYGKTGSAAPPADAEIQRPIDTLHERTQAPIAVGFGVRTRADVERVHATGADAAIVGSAVVARVEKSLTACRDVVDSLAELVTDLTPTIPTLRTTWLRHGTPTPTPAT